MHNLDQVHYSSLHVSNIFLIGSLKLFCIVKGSLGLLLSNGLMVMCRWMGSHFYGWIDYNGVAFLLESLEWD